MNCKRYFISLIALFLLASPAHSAKKKVNQLLICLGAEEFKIHKKKEDGPRYYLNQTFINKLSGFDDILIRPQFIAKICQDKEYPPEVQLLRLLLVERENLFDLKNLKQEAYKKQLINDLLQDIPHLLFQYIAQLRVQTPYAHCLEKHVPEIQELSSRYKYLEGDLKMGRFIDKGENINTIFKKLKNLPRIIEECNRDTSKEKKK